MAKVKFAGLYMDSVGGVVAESGVVDATLNLDAAYLDFDPTGIGYARLGAKRNGPGTSAGAKIRTLNAGAYVDAVTFAADGTPTFAKPASALASTGVVDVIGDTVGFRWKNSTPASVGFLSSVFGWTGAGSKTDAAIAAFGANMAFYANGNNTPGMTLLASNILAMASGLQFPATAALSSDPNTVDRYVEGSYTATMTGCTTSPTCTVYYTKIGNVVHLMVAPDTYVSGTSNTTSKTLTGMPAELRPSRAVIGFVALTSNSGGVYAASEVDIHTDGTIQYYPTANGGAWTASGTATLGPLYAVYTLG